MRVYTHMYACSRAASMSISLSLNLYLTLSRGDSSICVQCHNCQQLFVLHSFALSSGCDGRLDIVLIIDVSSTVRRERLSVVLTFLTDVIDQFDVQPNRTRFGAVTYGNGGVGQSFSLDAFQSKQDVILAVSRLPFIGGSTRLSAALQYLVGD